MTRKGFTLLEVLIVVIIIGILASIAMPQYLTTLEKARSAEALSSLGSLRSSIDRYWYDQVALTSTYTAATMTKLDITVDATKWTYTISDSNGTGFPNTKSYFFTAERVGKKSSHWVQINHTGEIRKSTALGGADTKFVVPE